MLTSKSDRRADEFVLDPLTNMQFLDEIELFHDDKSFFDDGHDHRVAFVANRRRLVDGPIHGHSDHLDRGALQRDFGDLLVRLGSGGDPDRFARDLPVRDRQSLLEKLKGVGRGVLTVVHGFRPGHRMARRR